MLISISTVVVGLFLFLYLRAIHSGQYEDVESPAIRMLFEDEIITPPAQESPEEKNMSHHVVTLISAILYSFKYIL